MSILTILILLLATLAFLQLTSAMIAGSAVTPFQRSRNSFLYVYAGFSSKRGVMPKIAFFELDKLDGGLTDYFKDQLHKLERKFVGMDKQFFDGPLRRSHLPKIKEVDALCVFIGSKVTREVIDALPSLKYVVTMSTGFDHIDVEECSRRGIKVCNVPTYGENSVAEHTFALINGIARNLVGCVDRTRDGHFTTEGLRGFDLKGKTLGVIGTGNIGKFTCKIALGYSMDVIAYDKYPDEDFAAELGFEYVEFPELLRRSDIISIHVPLLPATEHMIDREAVKQMKKGVIIINTARGGIIDTDALILGLKEGIIAYAGLDVLEDEDCLNDDLDMLSEEYLKKCDIKTVLQDHILMEQPNVYVTPHNAFNTVEAIKRIMDCTVENLVGLFSGEPQNLVQK